MRIFNPFLLLLHAASGGSVEDARRHAEQAAFDMVLLGHTLACESHVATA
jgi:hypothetical protein